MFNPHSVSASGSEEIILGWETFVSYSFGMTSSSCSRGLAILALTGTLQACTLVGYPAGTGQAPARSATPTPTRVAGPTSPPPGSRPSDPGRTYEVFGERYKVLDSAEGYDAEGVASWYGKEFDGRPTASGETFDMDGFSAAHRTLPLHTWVHVTNLANGRSVVLRINDRGPFAHTETRIIDLSYGAARELDMVGTGTARVKIRALSADEVSRLR